MPNVPSECNELSVLSFGKDVSMQCPRPDDGSRGSCGKTSSFVVSSICEQRPTRVWRRITTTRLYARDWRHSSLTSLPRITTAIAFRLCLDLSRNLSVDEVRAADNNHGNKSLA